MTASELSCKLYQAFQAGATYAVKRLHPVDPPLVLVSTEATAYADEVTKRTIFNKIKLTEFEI